MSVSNRCIWCLDEAPNASFKTESHVLPECVGNKKQQVLPKGIVCDKCNQYFGSKIEPVLLGDPLFHVVAVLLRLRDPSDMNEFRDNVFDSNHRPVGGVARNLNLDVQISPNSLEMNLRYQIEGKISKTYLLKDLSWLSRAIHKIAFESLVWSKVVQGKNKEMDLFDPSFSHIRSWSRKGHPTNTVRPVARKQHFDIVKPEWEFRVWKFEHMLAAEINLFGDWYVVNLTSPPEKADADLKKQIKDKDINHPIWYLTERLGK